MKISSTTKISALIKENPEAITAIASINKHFEKLKNPILRKLLAGRVTIADAAKIGGTKVEEFFKVLKPLGFEIENAEELPLTANNTTPVVSLDKVIELDVRSDLEKGADPFTKILKQASVLPERCGLKIINTFEPIPLIHILSKKGFGHFVEIPSEGIISTTFYKTSGSEISSEKDTYLSSSANTDFNKKKDSFKGRIHWVDVRHLEMPLPMVTILDAIEKLNEEEALFVNHRKIPQFLIPELKNRGYYILINEVEEGNVELLIFSESKQ